MSCYYCGEEECYGCEDKSYQQYSYEPQYDYWDYLQEVIVPGLHEGFIAGQIGEEAVIEQLVGPYENFEVVELLAQWQKERQEKGVGHGDKISQTV